MLTFAVEKWSDVWREAEALWPLHYDEVGEGRANKWTLNPDLDLLGRMEAAGKLQIVVARDLGKLVGYHAKIVEPLLHYKQVLAGKSDLYWLHPEHRGGRNGLRLFENVESAAKARGVQVLYEGTKIEMDHGPLLEHLGYVLIEKRYRKRID